MDSDGVKYSFKEGELADTARGDCRPSNEERRRVCSSASVATSTPAAAVADFDI